MQLRDGLGSFSGPRLNENDAYAYTQNVPLGSNTNKCCLCIQLTYAMLFMQLIETINLL